MNLSEGSCFTYCLNVLCGYVTSACWQTETAKTPSRHAVSSSEPANPWQKKAPDRRLGRNSCSGSAKKVGCPGLRFCTPFDATAHRCYRYDDRLQSTNPISSLLRKNHSFSPCHTIAKKRPFLPFPIIGRPFYNNVGSHLDRDRHKTGQQGSLLTGLSTEKTRKIRLKRHSLWHAA
jgi:hypothetical protein